MWLTLFPLRKFYAEQMLALLRTKRMQLRNHADSKTMKRSLGWKGYAIYTYNIKFGLLEVRENEISLRTVCSGTRQLLTLEGTLVVNLSFSNFYSW